MTAQVKAIAIESSLDSILQNAYWEFPSLHGNLDVLNMLKRANYLLNKEWDTVDKDNEDSYDFGYEEGAKEGRKEAINDYFEPIDSAAHALIEVVENRDFDDTPKLIKDLEKELSAMEKEYKS